MLIFYKAVDKSVLTEGLSIPITYQQQIFSAIGFTLERGQKRNVTIQIGTERFNATMTNIQFDHQKYPSHKDILQIRYNRTSALCRKLQEVFQYTGELLVRNEVLQGTKRISGLSEDQKEFLAIYSTPIAGELTFDCITNSEFRSESIELASLGERTAEGILDGTDEHAGIRLATKACKIRILTKSIVQDLKAAYGYRCQVCGQYIGERYGSKLIHAHHIDYFSRSMNNNANNIMILCPNHHGIIHDQNPTFDYKHKIFQYPNGYEEGLKLNLHL